MKKNSNTKANLDAQDSARELSSDANANKIIFVGSKGFSLPKSKEDKQAMLDHLVNYLSSDDSAAAYVPGLNCNSHSQYVLRVDSSDIVEWLTSTNYIEQDLRAKTARLLARVHKDRIFMFNDIRTVSVWSTFLSILQCFKRSDETEKARKANEDRLTEGEINDARA